MRLIALVVVLRFIALVYDVRFIAFINASRFIAFCIVVSSIFVVVVTIQYLTTLRLLYCSRVSLLTFSMDLRLFASLEL